MNLEYLLKHVNSMTDIDTLALVSRAVQSRYRELLKEKCHTQPCFSSGDTVSFRLRNGKKIKGVIERRGKVNYRVAGEDGKIYRVPIGLVIREQEKIVAKTAHLPFHIDDIVPSILEESKRLLYHAGIELHVRYKKGVWATHFRQNRYIQFGEDCIRYQALPHKTSDGIASNLKRFNLKNDPASRISMLVCHEVAHAIAHHRYGQRIMPHGRQYYKVLTELVEGEFGDIRSRLSEKLSALQKKK